MQLPELTVSVAFFKFCSVRRCSDNSDITYVALQIPAGAEGIDALHCE